MKQLTFLLLLFSILCCNQNSKSTSATLVSLTTSNDLEKQLKENLHKKYIKYNFKTLALINSTIVDGTGSEIKYSQTIIIEDGLFSAVGNDYEIKIPKNAKIIDLKGKTVIPGIVGMHNHLHIPGFPDVGDISAKLYLASGVTTIQTCGAASPYKELELSKKIAEGNVIGPDIIPSAPFITGIGGNPNMIIPRNETHLRDTIQHWLYQGVKWFKVYRNISPDDLKTVIDEAHKNNAKVRGHLCSVTFEEASKWGIDGIEHGLNSTSDFRTNKEFGVCGGGREYMDEIIIGGKEVKELHKLMIDNKVVLTSTLSIYEASIPNRAYADERTLQAMSPYLKNQYEERRKTFDEQLSDLTRNNSLKRIMQFEYQYFKMGGLLCSGVDAGRHVLPGFGDQRNYELHIETGFSTEEAVQIMTGNGARALERFDIGTLEVGKRADLVILDGNLKENSTVIKKVETVFKNGVGYDSEKILLETTNKFGID
ncbi:MAG TPA: amidohydrolase family protein [Saprospiraceae bacterium]|nr:amidohydrolase family protein [Saprospiraceae bacterium]